MTKLSEEPLTVTCTTPVLESPFLSMITDVPPFVLPLPLGRLVEVLLLVPVVLLEPVVLPEPVGMAL